MTKWMVFQSLMKHWQSVYLFDPEGFFLHAIEESIGYEIREEKDIEDSLISMR